MDPIESAGPLGAIGTAATMIGLSKNIFDILNAVAEVQALEDIRIQKKSSLIILSFRNLQRVRIEDLQKDLLDLTQKNLDSQEGKILEGYPDDRRERRDILAREIDAKLHVYANAIRDYEVLSEEAVDYSNPKPSKFLLAALFRRINPREADPEHLKRAAKLKKLHDSAPRGEEYMFRELNREIRLEREKSNAFWERLWMGGFGGIALIGPMLLMVLHRDLNTSIITASVATVLFAIFLAVTARSLGGKDVLAAVAAYAAVLVVFVGTSMTPIS